MHIKDSAFSAVTSHPYDTGKNLMCAAQKLIKAFPDSNAWTYFERWDFKKGDAIKTSVLRFFCYPLVHEAGRFLAS